MVATDEQANQGHQHATDSGSGASNTGALNKMKATLSSSLLTVTDKGESRFGVWVLGYGLANAFRKCMRIYGMNFYASAHKAARKTFTKLCPCNAKAS